LADLN
jgi:16S rRNA (uracil1498-N3)-methyltransferase